MDTDQQLEVLRRAAAGTLPERIDSGSTVPVLLVKDLVNSGHLEALNASNLSGPGFLSPRITTSGREHLRALEERAKAASVSGKVTKHLPAFIKWFFAIIAALIVAYLTKRFIS
ncbi:MAG: hypothetical protein ABI389_10155 [Rhodanobacter sp.]